MIVGIEGPAGAGKTTMAQAVAPEFGAVVIEGGVWYRALAYMALTQQVGLEDVDGLCRLAKNLQVKLLNDTAYKTRIIVNSEDVTDDLYEAATAAAVAPIAHHLEVREIIEPLIVAAAREYDDVVIVGRFLKRALPEAAVLRLTIDDEAAEQRNRERGHQQSVTQRNRMDAATGAKLGVTPEGVTLLDVTHLSKSEQAEALRQFIKTSFSDVV